MAPSNQHTAIYTEEVYIIPPLVTVVIGEPWNQIPEEHRQLLNKILQAVRQSLESIRVIHQPEFNASAWSERPARVVSFTKPPKGLLLYEVIQTGETEVVFSDPLSQLISDDGAKRKLWSALKSLFGI